MHAAEAGLALFWACLSASGLLVGGLIGYYAEPSRRTVAWVMAFSSGVFITVIAFDLVEESYSTAGMVPTGIGFLAGAILFTALTAALGRYGEHQRRRGRDTGHGARNPTAAMIAIVLDGMPESIVIGLTLIDGTGVALPTVIGIFIANIPEAISTSANFKAAGRRARQVFMLWFALIVLSAIWALAGYLLFSNLHPAAVAVVQSVVAGALLAMIANTAIPEAFAEAREETGLAAAIGFIAGFALSHGL